MMREKQKTIHKAYNQNKIRRQDEKRFIYLGMYEELVEKEKLVKKSK